MSKEENRLKSKPQKLSLSKKEDKESSNWFGGDEHSEDEENNLSKEDAKRQAWTMAEENTFYSKILDGLKCSKLNEFFDSMHDVLKIY